MGIALFENGIPHQFFFNYVGQLVSFSTADNDTQLHKWKKKKGSFKGPEGIF